MYDLISIVPQEVPQALVSEQQCCLEMANSLASQSFAHLEVNKRVVGHFQRVVSDIFHKAIKAPWGWHALVHMVFCPRARLWYTIGRQDGLTNFAVDTSIPEPIDREPRSNTSTIFGPIRK